MRVIAGELRGSVIRTPAGGRVRPTYDRVRESLFSMIEPRLEGAAVLDLFAGSGGLGIECLSRCAESVTFVEVDPSVMRVVRENVGRLGLAARCRLISADALVVLGRAVPGGPFDIVFVDPPYASGLSVRALELLEESHALAEDALVVVERATADPPPDETGRLDRFRTKAYGSTTVDFYEARAHGAGREEDA